MLLLNAYAAQKRLQIFEDLKSGRAPREGEFSRQNMMDAKSKGQPQMGTTRYEPLAMVFEFVYPDPGRSAVVLTVTLTPPERIVFLPVPKWVIENIWQGEISGSAHFESEALRLLEEFQLELAPEENPKHFAPRPPVSRQ